MWKIQRWIEGEQIVLSLSGRIQGQQLAEVGKILESEGRVRGLVLDLKEVKLVDQEVVSFLVGCETGGIQLRNCPSYIREWITRVTPDGDPNRKRPRES